MTAKTVAVLDDDEVFLAALTQALRPQLSVLPFSSTAEFLGYVDNAWQDIDMVCVDLHMPDDAGVVWQLAGLSTASAIRSKLKERTPHICVLTGLDAAVHSSTCFENGADAFVEKTHDIEEVAEKVAAQAARC